MRAPPVTLLVLDIEGAEYQAIIQRVFFQNEKVKLENFLFNFR